MILLDTDIMIDILRDIDPAVRWFRSLGSESVLLPGVVAMELIQGARNKADITDALKFLKRFPLLWNDQAASNHALEIFAKYQLSHSIGLMDSMIAALALSQKLPLHTLNKKHYAGIKELKTIQPYKRR